MSCRGSYSPISPPADPGRLGQSREPGQRKKRCAEAVPSCLLNPHGAQLQASGCRRNLDFCNLLQERLERRSLRSLRDSWAWGAARAAGAGLGSCTHPPPPPPHFLAEAPTVAPGAPPAPKPPQTPAPPGPVCILLSLRFRV